MKISVEILGLKQKLLQLYSCTSSLELALQILSVSLGYAFLYRSRSAINQSLSFLQAETSSLTNSLDYVDLACASVLQNYIELGLLSSSAASSRSSSSNSYRSSSQEIRILLCVIHCI